MDSPLSRRAFLRACVASAAGFVYPSLQEVSQSAPPPARFLMQWGQRGKAEGELDIPIGLAIGPHEEVFVAEFRNSRVSRFDRDGTFLAAYPVAEQPGGIAVDAKGNIYVAHLMPGKISVLSPTGQLLSEWGKLGKREGEFQQPGGIAIGRDGSVYIADQVNRRVQKFTAKGVFLRAWGEYGTGPGQFGGNVNPASRVGGPQFLALDRRGNVYTTEASVGRIQKFTPDGKYLLSWGDNGTQPGGFGGRPANLPGPIGIVVDHRDRVWVGATNHRIQQFTSDGRYLGGFGGEGTAPGQFRTPHGLAIDRHYHLYVCDTQNARIQKFEIIR